MKTKTLWILTAIFIGILSLTGLTIFGPSFLSQQKPPYEQQLKGAQGASIATITIAKADEQVVLQKENDVWKVSGKKAQQDSVTELLDGFIDKPSTELIAQTNKQHEEFGVASGSATTVQLGDTLKLLIGNETVGGTYVRIDGSDNVFLVHNITDLMLSVAVADWYDKMIIELDETKLQKIQLKQTGEIVLMKKDDKWVVQGSEDKTDDTKVHSIVAQFNRYIADTLVDDPAVAASYSAQPKLTITLTYDGGSETLNFFQGKDNWLTQRSDKQLFTVSQSQVEDLLVPQKDLLTQ